MPTTTTQVGVVWSDLHHSIVQDSTGGIKLSINIEAVKTSIDNILRTYPSERVMLPSFASNLHNILFNIIDDHMADSVSRDIRDAIEKWDDRIIVNSIDISTKPDANSVFIALFFSIKGFSRIFEHTFTVKEAE